MRYLRGLRSANAVPILSRISMIAVGVSSAAMIIIFSVFNGLESLLKENYNAFYPEIKISPTRGKFFSVEPDQYAALRNINGVTAMARVIEDQVFAVNNGQQIIISLKGIENNYLNVIDLKPHLSEGSADSVVIGQPSTAIAGRSIMNELGTDINTLSRITLNYANPEVSMAGIDPTAAIVSLTLHPSGEFQIGDEFDGKYVLGPLLLVQDLFHQPGKYSAIEVKTPPEKMEEVQAQMKKILGDKFVVASRFEQNKTLYMVMRSEKWAIFAILVMVLLIATFNMVGTLSMLVLQKEKDIAILQAMGAQQSTIRSVFLLEGIMWSVIGGAGGMLIGIGVCLIQQKWHIVGMGSTFDVPAFPVEIQLRDVVLDLVTVTAIGLLVSWYPAVKATKVGDPSLKSA